MSGWTKQHRKRFEKAKFQASKQNPFCFGYAFDWLVANAEYDKNNGLERGQLLASYRILAKKWGWSIGKVQRFLDWLVDDQSIRTDTRLVRIADTPTNTPKLLITICNYEKYIDDQREKGT